MANKNKNKGSSFEREMANYLTTLYNVSFIRTIGSGSYIGGSNSFRKNDLSESQTRSHKGDITPDHSFNKMNMECKFYSEFHFHQLFGDSVPLLDKWIEQCLECADDGDINILCIKINYKGKFVCIEANEKLKTEKALKYKNWYFYSFKDFFDDNKEIFKELCNPNKGAN